MQVGPTKDDTLSMDREDCWDQFRTLIQIELES